MPLLPTTTTVCAQLLLMTTYFLGFAKSILYPSLHWIFPTAQWQKWCFLILQLMLVKTSKGSLISQVTLCLRDGCQWGKLLIHELLQGKEGLLAPDTRLAHVWYSWNTVWLVILCSSLLCSGIPGSGPALVLLEHRNHIPRTGEQFPGTFSPRLWLGAGVMRMVCSCILYPK